jgi:methylated-DNA-[protein]-cysteine S-methyltransferase
MRHEIMLNAGGVALDAANGDGHAQPWHTIMPSVLGELTLVRDQTGLRGLYFPHHWYRPGRSEFGPRMDGGFGVTSRQLREYLAGARQHFELPLAPAGDQFQRTVWDLIMQVPYGDTVTYGELASRIGGEVTAQQVGAAVGRNPLCILVPCHRVVGRNGKLTGYAGGIGRKRYLLELERENSTDEHGQPTQNQSPLDLTQT